MPFPLLEKVFLLKAAGMDQFVVRAGRKMRLGYTTGSCAALAARAAVRMLLTGREESRSALMTPNGVMVDVALHEVNLSEGRASCAVQKDAGDDPDATNGIFVHAAVWRTAEKGVAVEGGVGVGRVTKPGLDQPVGAAAINSVPRRMIESEVLAVCDEFGYAGGVGVLISIPGGEAIAAKTFNPKLGIEGGLSVIGTTGIVEPMSTRAMIDSIRVEMNVLRAGGETGVILTPGNYGESFLRSMPSIALRPHVKCGNFVGESLDAAADLGFADVLLVGHIGKLIKLAGGIMDTHSRTADCRLELLALQAALAGAEQALVRRLLEATTVDDGLSLLGGLHGAVIAGILERAEAYVRRRAGDGLKTGIVSFSNHAGLLGVSQGAGALLALWEKTSG